MDINKTYITKPSLPPLEELEPYLKKIWENKTLTNCGQFHEQLESELATYLNVDYVSLCSNGTIALVIALQALGVQGEVITTPFSFVATSHALLWTRNKPVFVDIDQETLNINPDKIEASITEKTSAILPVHCYGHPCDVDAIQRIADKFNLKVIYDAAHAFGVNCHCGSLMSHGDLSVLSFHATKIFNTFEGGAVVCKDRDMKRKIDLIKNFGISSETEVSMVGINGKMSEFNAALGLLQLKHVDKVLADREKIDRYYRKSLENVNGIYCLKDSGEIKPNFSYFPIIVADQYSLSRDQLYNKLKDHNINSRRYFYPLISNMQIYNRLISANPHNLPVANKSASQILCLPIYPDLELEKIDEICKIIQEA